MYDDICKILCLDTNISTTGEILDFKPEKKLIVSINRTIRMDLEYNTRKKKYIGKAAGMEFVTDGPKQLT